MTPIDLVPSWWTRLLSQCKPPILQRELSCAAPTVASLRRDEAFRLALAWARSEGDAVAGARPPATAHVRACCYAAESRSEWHEQNSTHMS